MSTANSTASNGRNKDFLTAHVRELPYFRALLRAIESTFYQDEPLQGPIYDLGCGDGHFASLTFTQKIDVGLDPWRAPLHEAKKRGAYRGLVEADAARAPFPSKHFGGAMSNSVLEHIPHIQSVLNETGRILKPGGHFLFCVPNEKFTRNLSVARLLDRLRLHRLAEGYRRFFNRISRHVHCDPPEVWRERLEEAGFEIETFWHYFSPSAVATLEWGHFFGLPSAAAKFLLGRWVLVPTSLNLGPTLALVRPYYNEPVPQEQGAYTFYVTRRTAAAATRPSAEEA